MPGIYDLEMVRETLGILYARGDCKVVIVCTGAGAGVSNLMWSVAGSSSTFVGYHFPYGNKAFDHYIRHDWAFSKVCEEAAIALAQAAYFECQRERTESEDVTSNMIGIGLTAAASTNRTLKGGTRCYCAVRTRDGISTFAVVLPQGKLGRIGDGEVCDIVALNALFITTGLKQIPFSPALELVSTQLNQTGQQLFMQLAEVENPNITSLDKPVFVTLEGTLHEISLENFEKTLIYPGSFGPVQWGHDEIAHEAQMATGHRVVFEITAGNVDKHGLQLSSMLERASKLKSAWPVILRSDAGLFLDKLQAYPNVAGFIVGADTAIRLLNPDYYKSESSLDGTAGLMDALETFNRAGVKFYVVDRLLNGALLTINDLRVPLKFGSLFVHLPGRWDISSTEIRNGRKS